jgi:hypothetical protein
MQGPTSYRGFQEPRNQRLAWGAKPPDTTDLLAPATEAGEDSATSREATSVVVPTVTSMSLVAFSTAVASAALLSVAILSATAASSVALFPAAASTSFFTAVIVVSSAAPNVLGAATRDVTTGALLVGARRRGTH